MKITAIRPAYLPPLKTFWNISQVDVALFADHLQYVKRSDITASAPLTPEEQRLRIPVKHNPQPLAIAQKITNAQDNWQRKHWQTLRHVYHDYPFAYYYLPQVQEWYAEAQDSLADFLFKVTTNLGNFLHLDVSWKRSSEIQLNGLSHEDYIIKSVGAQQSAEYLTERKNGLDWDILQMSGIQRRSFTPLPSVHLFQSYAGESVLTFLMQFGPKAGYMIRQFQVKDN